MSVIPIPYPVDPQKLGGLANQRLATGKLGRRITVRLVRGTILRDIMLRMCSTLRGIISSVCTTSLGG